jgi:hypothetical protein
MPTPYHVTSACGSCFTSSLANSNSSVFFFNSKRHVKYAGTYAVLNSSSRRILCHRVSNFKPIWHRCALPNCFHTFCTWLDSPQTCSEPTESQLGFALHPRYYLIHRRAPLCFELQRPHVDVNTTNGAKIRSSIYQSQTSTSTTHLFQFNYVQWLENVCVVPTLILIWQSIDEIPLCSA